MKTENFSLGRSADEILRLAFTSEYLLEALAGREMTADGRPTDGFWEIKSAAAAYVAGLREEVRLMGADMTPTERALLRKLAYLQMLVQVLFLRRADSDAAYGEVIMSAARDAARAAYAVTAALPLGSESSESGR